MKKLRIKLDAWLSGLNSRWRSLSLERQQKYILLLFAAYLLLSVSVILKVWYDVLQPSQGMSIEHIENPVIPKKDPANSAQDSISKILKKKMYELNQ